jgi:hypothetical protein
MAKETLAPFPNVWVEGFSGLLMDFLQHDACSSCAACAGV